MLQLQRASAGSGKTFTLAKKFIWFLITTKEPGGKPRLRNRREIIDALPRILAITFTNKATNEMKLRIVEKLADMTRVATDINLPAEEIKKIAYLSDFAGALHTDITKVAQTAVVALEVLLNEYSDFKVSTIDSFFQNILRTFAYESNLNDAYQVEIDNDYVASAAIDATLNDINDAKSASAATFWLRELMQMHAFEGKTTWNVFQKANNESSIYTLMRNAVLKLEKEDFKEVRMAVDQYFDLPSDAGVADDPLIKAYLKIKRQIIDPMESLLAEARTHASELTRLFKQNNLDISKDGHRYLAGHLRKLKKLSTYSSSSTDIFKPLSLSGKTSILAKSVDSTALPAITEAASKMYDAYSRWLSMRETPEWLHWSVYAPNIPYLGILGHARRNLREFLDANNTIQLGETNSMLRKIIGDDDTPFIYERLGSTINHFLIDEFQDTSRLQWENLRPLLSESNARGEDNLIIGDAKQSIYRFRNADPSLITTNVPQAFPSRIDAGSSIEDNTNWRSDRTIVEFNNFFFSLLIEEIKGLGSGTIDFADLYSNVAQFASHRDRKGYVEINFIDPPMPEEEEEMQDKAQKQKGKHKAQTKSRDELASEIALEKLPGLIKSLLERGFRQQDIAILTRTKKLGKEVIDSLVVYNSKLPHGEAPLEFISEESLLVSSSEAVGIIISVLRSMTEGTDIRNSKDATDNPDNNDNPKISWTDIKCNFSYYALRHPEMSAADQVRNFLAADSHDEALSEMLSHMQTVALPALVEAITENFVPDYLRKSQAVFIAALQDMVLEFAERYASDVPSFLCWWDAKGESRSISSPEGTDAIQVMTIHKSKGLEFKCVIIPYNNDSLLPGPKKVEWKWVSPAPCMSEFCLPPFMPVDTKNNLTSTSHADVWYRYSDLYLMDMLNSYYVAFTRAVSELYIFTGAPQEKSKKIGNYLFDICNEAGKRLSQSALPDSSLMLPPELINWNVTHDIITIGSRQTLPPHKSGDDSGEDSESRFIENYNVDSSPAILQYVEGEDEGGTATPEEADSNPRSEGNLLHAVMENVAVAGDLSRSMTAMLMKGLISREQMKEWLPLLSEAISSQPAAGWFDPSWTVLNERSIIFRNAPSLRPDRILMAKDRSRAVVVDYKFGAIPKDSAHTDQVAQYVSALKEATGICNVEGYVWYVRLGKIIKAV